MGGAIGRRIVPTDDDDAERRKPDRARTALAAVSRSRAEPDDALEAPPVDDAAEAYQQRARLAEDRLAEVLGRLSRAQDRERGVPRAHHASDLERRFDQRHEALLLKFIDILDNLDRALEAAETSYAGEPLIEGLILVRTQLLRRCRTRASSASRCSGCPSTRT